MFFSKYHGLSNDFVIIDSSLDITSEQVRNLANRRTGIGFDQLLLICPSSKENCDAKLRIFNGDGGEAEACGNGTRCVVHFLAKKLGKKNIRLDAPTGVIPGLVFDEGDVQVEQGVPKMLFDKEIDTIFKDAKAFGVDMGNPHLVIFMKDEIDGDKITELGPQLEHHPLFPNKTNVEFCLLNPDQRSVRVWMWERGAGRTSACGSGACAVAFAAIHLGYVTSRTVDIVMDGGRLKISQNDSGVISQRGEAVFVFDGTCYNSLLME